MTDPNIVKHSDYAVQQSRQREHEEAEKREVHLSLNVESTVTEDDLDHFLLAQDPWVLDELDIEDRKTDDEEERQKAAEYMVAEDARRRLGEINAQYVYIDHTLHGMREPDVNENIERLL